MPIGAMKNTLYGLALPMLGKRCEWKKAEGDNPAFCEALSKALKKRHVVGACVQCFRKGELEGLYTAGYAALEPQKRPVTGDTYFRSASVAKMVSALLVFRLQTLGKLSVHEDISEFLGYRVSNPHCPDAPITLGMLLNHTSSIVDSPAYFASFQNPTDLSALLRDSAAFAPAIPGIHFRYSNLAAGMVGCTLEARFGESIETLIRRELFAPLSANATFELHSLANDPPADSYRVLPPERCFDANARLKTAKPIDVPNPERHYLFASGGLYLTAEALARLALTACNGHGGFLDEQSLKMMHHPVTEWPEKAVRMRHGMGLLQLDDHSVCPRPIWGHQGFAYGAVNGVFFDEEGNGFAMLNSGASEQRVGHLALVNRDLISLCFGKHADEYFA